jgi:hypothetical protein
MMTRLRSRPTVGLVALAIASCAGPQFTPQQEWVYTKFPECQTRTNALNVKLERVDPDGGWHASSQQTQTDYNLVVACMKEEWAKQVARLQKDDAEALRWYRAGAEAGDPGSMYGLGLMYETGRGGLPRDRAQAVSWYRKSAAAGYEPASRRLRALGEP